MKMTCMAYDRAGKKVRETVEAASQAEAGEILRRRGLYITDTQAAGSASPLGRAPAAPGPAAGPRRRAKIGTAKRMKLLMMFSRQLFVLVSTGTPLVEALHAIHRQTKDPLWAGVVDRVRSQIEQGVSLHDAMSDQPEYFDAITRSLVAAGESSGKLPTMLERISQLTRKQVHIRSSIIGAMVYPALLIVVAVAVLGLMLMFVLPRFGDLFKSMDVPLPPTTAALMAISRFLLDYWYTIPFGVIGLVVALRLWLKTGSGIAAMHTAVLRLPQLGKISQGFATARLIRLMGILLDSYLPLLDVLRLVKDSTTNMHYRALLDHAEAAVTRGEPISTAFNDPRLINSSVYEAIRSGEQSGQVAPLMLNIADFLDEDNEVIVKSLTSIIEPVILIVLGGLVGLVAVSMFMPLFDLTAMTGGGK
jgi:type IV pilus assembly protein PilC